MNRFYLGTHEHTWLSRPELVGIPLFVSHRRLARRATWRPAVTDWALDSGGFTELAMFHGWTTTPQDYVTAVRHYAGEIGRLAWASPQDWMCEPAMLTKTGLTVTEHQYRTVANYLQLRDLAPDLPFVPVLQGFEPDDYLRCVDLYDRAGVDLTAQPIVGVGTVCRRQGVPEIADLFRRLGALDLNLHGYGVKTLGLRDGAQYLTSSDSLAWSQNGRRNGIGDRRAHPTCTHQNCANCLHWALQWRARLLASLPDIPEEKIPA